MNYKKGSIIKVKVNSIKHYGAFIETKDKIQGLIHISEISNTFIIDINHYLKVGEIIEVKLLSFENSKISATLNYPNRYYRKNGKITNIIKKSNFKYGFTTIKKNMFYWKKKAMKEIKYNKK